MKREDVLDILHRYRQGVIRSADDAADLLEGKSPAEPTGCQSCGGKGRIIDTTYDRTGAEVECEKCYGTGKSQAQIRAALAR